MTMKFMIPTLFAIAPIGGQGAEHGAGFPIPQALAAEHTALHEVLGRAVKEPGPLGDAARNLEQALHPHFQREEEIALPPLALLPRLAHGEASPDMADVLRMTDQLEKEMPRMLADHQKVVAALGVFRKAAEAAGRHEYVEFADELALHAQNEEQVTYPAALLVGKYVKLVLKR
jgi:iron-sulfur cluster repair protein YtfE (RIC family)